MTNSIKLALAASIFLGGCASTGAPLSAGSDQFAMKNFEAQVVDPAPAEGAPEMDAAMSAAAIERYRQGKTKTSDEDDDAAILTLNLTPSP